MTICLEYNRDVLYSRYPYSPGQDFSKSWHYRHLGQIIFYLGWGGGFLVHCRISSSMPGLCSLNASSTTPTHCTKKSLQTLPNVLGLGERGGGKIVWLSITVAEWTDNLENVKVKARALKERQIWEREKEWRERGRDKGERKKAQNNWKFFSMSWENLWMRQDLSTGKMLFPPNTFHPCGYAPGK